MASSASGGLLTAETEEDKQKLEGLKLFADVCHSFDVRPCAVTVLTSKDEKFVASRREFVEYVNAARLDQLPDHELGFVVPA